jgi:hypothetical protein
VEMYVYSSIRLHGVQRDNLAAIGIPFVTLIKYNTVTSGGLLHCVPRGFMKRFILAPSIQSLCCPFVVRRKLELFP